MVTTIIVALITAVLGPVVVAWVKDKLEKSFAYQFFFYLAQRV